MAHRIGEFVVAGEINNRKRNSVVGWLELDEERGVKLELTGNLPGELAGAHFRFAVQRADQPIMDEAAYKRLQFPQIGTPGDVTLRIAKDLPNEVLEQRLTSEIRGPLSTTERHCLYLEWHSQNGRVVAEIINPQIEHVADVESPSDDQSASSSGADADDSEVDPANLDDDDAIDPLDLSPDDEDEYDLFKPGLAEDIRRSSGDDEFEPAEEFLDDETPNAESRATKPREWNEVIPGLDPETKRMYEQWDEIDDGTRDEPLSTMFDPPIELPPVEQVTSEEKAESLIKTLLARLALHGVAIDVCEHYSYADVYRYLMTEVLPVANIHPNLPATGWVQHYSTWESCPDCEREFEEEYNAREANKPPEDEDD